MELFVRVATVLGCLFTVASAGASVAPFAIEIVDDRTGRGVPLVELTTVSNVRHVTDSAGLVALDEPALMGQEVFFHVKSHGYEVAADGFGIRGARLKVTPGGSGQIKIKRLNVAERLYRVTGEGIYHDSVKLGRPVPIKQPLLNGQVTGQDSAQPIVYRGKLYWFWGDTNRVSYPLGQFWMSGATSDLPGQGGLDPAKGVNLSYWVGADGFSRPMVPREAAGPAWLDGLAVLKGPSGADQMVAKVTVIKRLGEVVARRHVVFNDKTEMFDPLKELPLDEPRFLVGHPYRVEVAGKTYLYCGEGYPYLRVPAEWNAVQDPAAYEAFTPLATGSRYERANSKIERDRDGRALWAWKRNTPPLGWNELKALVAAGQLRADEVWPLSVDVETKRPVVLRIDSVQYNAHRRKWIGIAAQEGGDRSFLGEIWYTESDHAEGPWPWARKVMTHDKYSFYNPVLHPYFDQEGGRVVYYEGTYTYTFSREGDPTPRYDYNQIMYRLDLADPRLKMPAGAPPKPTALR